MRKITADRIFTMEGAPLRDTAIVVDGEGVIMDLVPLDELDPVGVECFQGAIIPGFVNAHCHLELSHMKGRIPTGTGLLPFIETVVKSRKAAEEEVLDAIHRADREMYDAGIMAVGDISNQTDTAAVKRGSRLRYYTFVECFDFMQEGEAERVFKGYYEVYRNFLMKEGDRKSMVPHAPYSVSSALYALIHKQNKPGSTVSIHNQETPPEEDLFRRKEGGFIEFYNSFGIDLSGFEATGRSSIHSSVGKLRPEDKNLFVHNTLTTGEDIRAATSVLGEVFWATCPNANLYIENRLPDYQAFLDQGATLCIGTDSLTSNWQLSIFEELRTLQKYKSFIRLEELLKWATINGARALGFESTLGSITQGKSPGLILISGLEDGRIGPKTECKRIL